MERRGGPNQRRLLNQHEGMGIQHDPSALGVRRHEANVGGIGLHGLEYGGRRWQRRDCDGHARATPQFARDVGHYPRNRPCTGVEPGLRYVRDDVRGPKGACRREHGVGGASAVIERQDKWQKREHAPPCPAFTRAPPNSRITVRNNHLIERFTLSIGRSTRWATKALSRASHSAAARDMSARKCRQPLRAESVIYVFRINRYVCKCRGLPRREAA